MSYAVYVELPAGCDPLELLHHQVHGHGDVAGVGGGAVKVEEVAVAVAPTDELSE